MSDETNGPKPLTLFEHVRNIMRLRHYSPRTEEAYINWLRRYIVFHGRRHPRTLGPEHVEAFLTHLAKERKVAASTQNQALAALLFVYEHALELPLPRLERFAHARRPKRLPVVLTVPEVTATLSHLHGKVWLVASLQYGSGLRLLEALTLRVKDLDFKRLEVLVREPKGRRDRVTPLPRLLVEPIEQHLRRVKAQHDADLAAGSGAVALPGALARKYPGAAHDWCWQWVFPATRHHITAEGERRRHHLHETVAQRAVRDALRRACIAKHASTHTLRHNAEDPIMPSRS